MHTTYIPINNVLPADTRHGKSIPESFNKDNQTRSQIVNVLPTG
jgi:hypothetical protein